jgi:DNA-binding transcriptional MerR regulator
MALYLTTHEAAERLRVSPQTMRLWRFRGMGPKYVKPSRTRCLYAEADLEAFLQERTFSSTAEETVSRELAAAAL